jgi:DNA replication protein DnaC
VAEQLFQVLAEQRERDSVIITTDPGFTDWTQVFGEPTLTAALIDRLTHKAHIINFNWELSTQPDFEKQELLASLRDFGGLPLR